MHVSPNQLAIVRLLLAPFLLALAASIAYVGTAVLGWESGAARGGLLLVAVLCVLLMGLIYRRLARATVAHAQIAGRERALAEHALGLDRLHAGLIKLQTRPSQLRWLALAERLRVADPAVIAGWERRYQQLRADPERRAFAERVLQGEFPSDLQIDYARQPERLLTCLHLQALESVLRQSGRDCVALAEKSIATSADLHPARTRKLFELADCVQWVVDAPAPHKISSERAFVCRICHSRIESGTGAAFPD